MITEWDVWFLDLAKKISTKSKDPSTKVGAIIVRPNNSICSTGFNGLPQKIRDRDEILNNREIKYKRIVHAEVNALIFAGEKIDEYTLYTYPFMPCVPCSSIFIQAGIKRVVAPYSDNERWLKDFEMSIENFKEAGVILDLYYEN